MKEILSYNLKNKDHYLSWVSIRKCKVLLDSTFEKERLLQYLVEKKIIDSIEEIGNCFHIGKVLRWNGVLLRDLYTKKIEKGWELQISLHVLSDLVDMYRSE